MAAGFVDYLRMCLGWRSAVPPVVTQLTVDEASTSRAWKRRTVATTTRVSAAVGHRRQTRFVADERGAK